MLGLAILVTAMALGLNSLGVSRAPRADDWRPAATSSSLLATRGFADVGVEQWRAFPGTFLTKGRLGVSTAPSARVQRNPAGAAVTDPLTDAAMAGMASHVLASAVRGTPVRASVFTGGPAPGETGPAVIAGHVDSRSGPAVFYRLGDLRPGDDITVERTGG